MLTQETPRLPLLDYSKPPPGIHVRRETLGGLVHPHTPPEMLGWIWHDGEPGDATSGERVGPEAGERGAVDLAWAHYKAENDPPGLLVYNEPEQIPGGVWMVDVLGEGGYFADYRSQSEARDAAWTRHDRRHALILTLAAQMAGFLDREAAADLLAKALAWTEADCAEMDIFLHTPCPEGVNPYREGPACLMLAVWGPEWKPPATARETGDLIRKAMDELGAAVVGLQVRHRGRIALLHPSKAGDPRGVWAAVVEVDADDEEDEGDLALGYGETVAQALDAACDQADNLENPSQFDGDNQAGPLGGGTP
jgi:hypothetical protein